MAMRYQHQPFLNKKSLHSMDSFRSSGFKCWVADMYDVLRPESKEESSPEIILNLSNPEYLEIRANVWEINKWKNAAFKKF